MRQSGGVWKTSNLAPYHSYIAPVFRKILPSEPIKILDAGCGNGSFTNFLAELGHEMHGVDLSEGGIEVAKKAFPKVSFEKMSVYESYKSFMPENGWDAIVTIEVIEHLFSPDEFLENLHKSLRHGGMLILTTPYHGYWKNLALSIFGAWDNHLQVDEAWGHIKFFSPKTLTKILKKNGFENTTFHFVGRAPFLWKSMISVSTKSS